MEFEVVHSIQPGFVQRTLLAESEDTIASFLEHSEWKFRLPTICIINGSPVFRRDWATTTISPSDKVEFVSRAHGSGGGGSKVRQVGALLALIAITAIAPWAAGPAALALSGFAYYATIAAITVAGGLLISTFLNPKAAATTDEPIAQLYSLTASGNVAAPLEPIPVAYGRLKSEPKYAGAPWHEYIGDDLFLNIPLCLGVGEFEHLQILVDDTLMWDHITGLQSGFTDVTWQYVEPGQTLTLFPSNVVESTEVSGQSVTDTPSPFFVVNAPGTLATKIVYDLVFPGGLFTQSPEGLFGNASVQLFGFVQQIDGAGSPIGSPVASVNINVTMCNRQPKRVSMEVPLAPLGLPPGRYSARLYRQNPESTSTTVQDAVVWAGLRGFLQGGDTFSEVSVLALRMKATAQLSQNAAKRIGVVQTRKLPVWNGSGFTTQATQNAFWAFLDAATNSVYGANRPLSKIDLNTIIAQAAAADSRGDTFNYVFGDSQVTFQAAFDLILQSARSKVSWVGDILSVVRDEWKPIPQMLIGDQQIIRGSLNIDYIFNEEEASDCVVGQFLNEDTWGPAQLQYPPNEGDFVGINPSTVRIEGITKPSHLYEELGFLYRQSQLRRIRLRLDTEHDGRLLRFGSPVKVQSFLPNKWGESGEVNAYNSGTHILTVSRNMPEELGQHYIELRDKGGHYFGPIKCSVVSGHLNQIQVDATDLAIVETAFGTTLVSTLDRMDGADPPSFVLGLAGNLSRSCIVITGKPSEDKVTLELTIDSEAVHVTNEGDTPPQPTAPSLRDSRVPVIINLDANFQQGIAEPYLLASWWPSAGAQYYRVQISYDSGTSWTPYPDQTEPTFQGVVSLAALRIRVAAVSASFHGPWAEKDVDTPTITIAGDTVSPESLKKGLEDYVMKILGRDEDNARSIRQLIASAAAELDANNYTDHQRIERNLASQVGSATASFNEAIEVATGPGSAIASQITTLQTQVGDVSAQVVVNTSAISSTNTALASFMSSTTASIGGLTSSVTTQSTAIASINTRLAAAYAITLDVNNYVSGLEFLNNGTTSSITFNTDFFAIAKPGILSPTTVFSLQTVGGVSTMALKGNFIADGVITTLMLNAGSVTTVKLAAGAVTATTIAAGAVNASKITAGSITATEIAVGGVDLLNLIAGAATAYFRTTYAAQGIGVTGSFTVVSSFSATIKSPTGLALVGFSLGVNWGSATNVNLIVDGSTVKTWTLSGIFASNLWWFVDGLSSGAHTFSLQFVTGASTDTWEAGQFYIQDLRR